MRWKSQRCCINNYDYDGLGEIPIRDFVCWDLFLVNWMELMIMRMEAMTISQFRPNFTISYWTCWGKEWKMKTVADKRKKWYCHQHQHVNPIWWESWSRGLVNCTQTFSTWSLPDLILSFASLLGPRGHLRSLEHLWFLFRRNLSRSWTWWS